MWKYKDIKEKDFENKIDLVEEILLIYGSEKLVITPELQKKMSTDEYSYVGNWIDKRPIFVFEENYYHINAVYFDDIPFIVIEWAESLEETMKNRMEDSCLLPYNISEKAIYQEVKYLLGIEQYPEDYNM